MKINRLLEITIMLLNRKSITAKELATHFNVSTRTIYRDIDVLSSAGVPVYTNKGNNGGISLLDDYTFNKTFLSKSEGEGLLLALKIISITQYPEINTILDKMGAIFKDNNSNDWIDINFAGWSSHPNERDRLHSIRNAIINRVVIGFDYINANGKSSSRFAQPMKLIFNTNTWYLMAYCLNRNSHRMFRLSRIKNVKLTNKNFEKRDIEYDACKDIENNSIPLTEFKLRFSENVLNRLYDDFDESFIHRSDGDILEVVVSMVEDEWVYGYIMSFGHYVEVIEPERVRHIIKARLNEAIKKY